MKNNKRIMELKKLIKKYDIQYYENGESEISDAEYDRLYDEYLAFEKQYPELKDMDDAPSRRVGAGEMFGKNEQLPKFTHKSPLLSIDKKAKTLDALKDFYDKCGGDGTVVTIQPKLDGITCNINYENGKLMSAATRGNGYVGDLITNNFKATDTKYPISLDEDTDLEIRGEAIIPYDYFKEKLVRNGKESEGYSNPRNAVAGIMRQLDEKEVKGKGVQVMFYDIGKTNLSLDDSDYKNVEQIKNLEFRSVPSLIVDSWKGLKHCVETNMEYYIQEIDGFHVLMDKKKLSPQAVCDGLVIKVDSLKQRQEIGMSEKGPKWAFAYKFKPLLAETKISRLEWQVGRTGKLTPVAVFKPISLGGVTITRATLNNYDYVKNLPVFFESKMVQDFNPDGAESAYTDFHHELLPLPRYATLSDFQSGVILQDTKFMGNQSEYEFITISEPLFENDVLTGFYITDELFNKKFYPFEEGRYQIPPQYGLQIDDIIIVERSNDVIPRIVAIKYHNYWDYPDDYWDYPDDMNSTLHFTQRKATFDEPSICPVCGSKLVKVGANHFCENISCSARLKASVLHFCSRDSMDIRGMGESIVDVLVAESLKYITCLSDIYELDRFSDAMLKINRFGGTKVDNLLNAIDDSKDCDLWKFIHALGIEGCGKSLSKDLSAHFKTIDAFLHANKDELLTFDGISGISADAIIAFLENEDNQKQIQKMLDLGVNPRPIEVAGTSLQGKTFVITGTLENPRSYYQELIEQNGGRVSGSVSKKTTAVLIGADAGSKEKKARDLVTKGENIELLDTEDKIITYLGITNEE